MSVSSEALTSGGEARGKVPGLDGVRRMTRNEGPEYTTNRCSHRHRTITDAVGCIMERRRADQGWHVFRADGKGFTSAECHELGAASQGQP